MDAHKMMVRAIIAPAGSNADVFPASLEIIEDGVQNGETVQTDSKCRLVLLAAKRSKQLNAPTGFNWGFGLNNSIKDMPQCSTRSVRLRRKHEDNVPGMPRALASRFPILFRSGYTCFGSFL